VRSLTADFGKQAFDRLLKVNPAQSGLIAQARAQV